MKGVTKNFGHGCVILTLYIAYINPEKISTKNVLKPRPLNQVGDDVKNT